MNSEFEGLLAAGTFSLVGSVPEGSNIVNAKWVYKWKTDSNGEISKAKARLVAKGFRDNDIRLIFSSYFHLQQVLQQSVFLDHWQTYVDGILVISA